MKKNYNLKARVSILLTCFAMVFAFNAKAQLVSAYTFTQTTGTYAAITGTDLFGTSWDDNVSAPLALGFNFNFRGVTYSSVTVNSNGHITFGATPSNSTEITPISSTTGYDGAVAGFGRDLTNDGGTASGVSYTTLGSAPNRQFVVQWTNARRSNSGTAVTGDVINFQILLNETSNIVSIMYGACTATSTANTNKLQLGLRGSANTEYNNRSGGNTTAWNAFTAGTSNTASVNFRNTVLPASGLTFSWLVPAIVNSVAITPTTAQCNATLHNVTATVTPGSNPLTSVTLNYSFNGVPQTPVTMTGGNVSSMSTWSGSIPAATPASAMVTWSVAATDGANTVTATGASYQDAVLTVTATATPSTICSGAAVNLNAVTNTVATGTVAIGTTTTNLTGATTQPTAFCNRWPSYRMQTVYTASELAAAGLHAGNITSIAYNITTLGDAATNANFTVKCGTTTVNSFTDFIPNTSFSTVFNPATYTHSVGVNVITFNTPYNWDGVSNLVVEVTHDGADNINNSQTYYTPTALNTVAWSNSGGTTGNPSTQRLNIVFGGQVTSAGAGTVNWQWNPGAINTNTAVVNPVNTGTSTAVSVYTVSATDPVTTCVTTATVGVNVVPFPTTPAVANSSQCGFGVPTASVSGGSSYNWYASPTSTTVLQSGASATYTTPIGTTTTFYVSAANGACESPRAAVTESVTIPDGVTATASSTLVCPGTAVTLTAVQSGTTNAYSFTWGASPVAGSGMPSPVTGSATVVNPTTPGTYVYGVSATDGVCTTVSSVTVTLNGIPNISNVTATPSVVCSGAAVNLSAISNIVSTGTVAIGTTTTNLTGTTTQPTAFCNRWPSYRMQTVYTAAELSAAGLSAGNITSISYSISTLGDANNNANYTVKCGTTTATSFTNFVPNGSFTTVYGPLNYIHAVGLNTITFTTPFNWDGVSNIIVEVTHDGADQINNSQTYYTPTAANTVAWSNSGGTTGNPSNQRLNVIFGGQTFVSNTSNVTWQWNPGAVNTNTALVNPTNPGTTPATQVYTVTATDPVTTCSNSATVGVTVNPLPATPVTANSSQCGFGVPTASVSGGTSYNWYASPTSTAVLQAGSSTNYTTSISNTTTFYVSSFDGTCESPRAAVTASVTIPDAVTATASSTLICPATSVTLTAVQTGTNNPYVFSWVASPAAGSGMPGTVSGATTIVTPSVAGTYVYSVTATDGICTTISTVNVTLNNIPDISNVSATPSVVCSGGNVMLNVSSYAAAAGTATVGTQSTTDLTGGPFRSGAGSDNRVQYLITAAELSAAGITPGNITSLSFSVTSLGSGTMPNFTIKMGTTTATSLTTTFDASPLSTVYGPSAYTAVANLNTFVFTAPFNWNGTSNVIVQVCHDAVSSGSSYISMASAANKTIYTTVTGACTQTSGTAYSSYRAMMIFNSQVGTNVSNSINWTWNPGAINTQTAQVNPSNPGTTPITQVYTITALDPATTCTNSATASVIVNPLPAMPTVFNSVQCGVGVPTASVSGGTSYNWYATPTSTTVLQSGPAATYTASISNTTMYYVTSFNGTCESPRATLTASVNIPDAITASVNPTALCPNTSATLTAANTGTTNNYSYTWTASPASGSGITTSVSGASVSIVPTLPGTYVYTVTGVDGVCTAVSSVSLTVNNIPSILNVSATPSVSCSGASVTLNAVSNIVSTGTVAIGTSTANLTGTTTQPTAFCNRWPSYRMQTVYTAAELSAAGLYAGNITSISYTITSLGDGATNANFTVKCGTTTATSFTNFIPNGSFSTVFNPATYTHSVGVNVITFDTPYNWDGVSNLVVEVSHDGADALYNAETYYTQTAANTVAWSTSGSTTGTPSNQRLNTVFGGQAFVPNSNNINWQWNPGAINTNTAIVNPTNTGTTPVTQVYTVTATDPVTTCTNSAVTSVTVNPIPNVAATTNTANVCAGSPAVLTASGATNYTWTPGASLNTASVTVNPTVTTTYTVTGESFGCSATSTVAVSAIPVPTVVVSASTPTICSGSSATFSVSGADTYSWMPGAQTATTIVVSPTVTTTYSVVGTSTVAGCSTTSTVNLAVFDVPSLTVTPASSTICASSTVTLSGSGATTYSWSSGGTANTEVVSPSASTTYTLFGTNVCGTSTTTAMVSTVTTPTVTASATSTLLCAGSTATITAGGAATYSWSSGASTSTIAVTPTASTVYTVTGTNACGSATAMASVSVAPIPNVTAVSSRTSICNGDFAVLNGNGATSYTWMPGGATTSSITITPTVTTTYTLTGKTSAGCTNVATVSQLVLPCTGINEAANASGIDIYPNPNVGSVNINVPAELVGHSSIQVFDAIGKLVIKENLTDESTHLNTSRLEEGLYIYKIYDNNGVIVKIGRMVRNK